MTIDPRAIELMRRYRTDFPAFAKETLKIQGRNPGDALLPFVLNKTQLYVHSRLEEQKQKIGRVRAYVLKGRKQGVSTYTQGRFYHRASLHKNTNAKVISHESSSTSEIFAITDRFQRNSPIAPNAGKSNARELYFDRLDSRYTVQTAGSKQAGRGGTPMLLHGSEVAFWEEPEPIYAGVIQAVPDVDDTEVVLESTANGAFGMFYEKWLDAEKGIGDYIAIFAPWFWEPVNSTPAPEGFELTTDRDDQGVSEAEYQERFGLSMDQMAWRRAKIQVLGSKKFRQEYPATAAEAFISSSDKSLIAASLVRRARDRQDIEGYGPLVIGVDPAGFGGDRFVIAARRGAKALWHATRSKIDAVEGAQWVRSVIKEHNPERVFIDAGGLGHGVVSILRSWTDTAERVTAVDFGSKSEHKNAKAKVPGPINRRSEMWWRFKEWLELPEGVSLPDDDALEREVSAPGIKPRTDNNLQLESKDDMRKRGIRSPDLADAYALTFASLSYVPVDKPGPAKKKEFFSGDTRAPHDPATDGEDYGGDLTHNGWMAY